MNYLNELRDTGLEVNWRTLLIGLEGPGKYRPLITLDDVQSFADELLATSTDPPESAVAIVVALSEDPTEAHATLRKLAEEEKSEPSLELRKWRLVLLRHTIVELPEDPVYGLLALTDFWERFDLSSDSPHVIQGRGNQLAPPDYFTEENYRHLLQKHRDWISMEATALRTRAGVYR
jgi:hypothetical protein